MPETITIEYKTQQKQYHCCGQKMSKINDTIKEFEFGKEHMLQWADWKEAYEDEELRRYVREYVYETIYFFAENSLVKITVENDQLDKVEKFILDHIINHK